MNVHYGSMPFKTKALLLCIISVAITISQAFFVLSDTRTMTQDNGVDGNIQWDITGDTLTLSVQAGQSGTTMSDYNVSTRPLWENGAGWSNVTKVVIENGITTIGDHAFYNCSSIESVTIPNSVTSVGNSAFDSSSITSITIPDSVISIGYSAFQNCISLTSVSLSNNLPSILIAVFMYCSSLTSITIPDSVSRIALHAFTECTSLTSITIPDSVITIEDSFVNCPSLSRVHFGNGLTSIYSDAFDLLPNSTDPTNDENSVGRTWYDSSGNAITLSAENMKGKTFIAENGDVYNMHQTKDGGTIGDINWYIVDDELVINPNGATAQMPTFSQSNRPAWESSSQFADVTKVVISSGITTIGAYSFDSEQNITSVSFNSNALTEINSHAFSGTSITSLSLPEGVTAIRGYALCIPSLTSITLPSTLTTISGGNTFRSCGNLVTITIPANVTSIGGSTFYECTSLRTVIFENVNNITSFGGSMFIRCSSLESVQISSNQAFTTIGAGTFKECSSLTTITVPSNITSIGTSAFDGCSNLSSIYIIGDITSIGDQSFRNIQTNAIIYLQDTTPATLGQDVFSSGQNITVYIKDTALSDYQTQWADYIAYLQQAPMPAITMPATMSVSVYATALIDVIITADVSWYYPVGWASQDSTIVSVDTSGNITTHDIVGTSNVTYTIHSWFYDTDITQTCAVSVIYNNESQVQVITGYTYDYTVTPSVEPATLTLYGNATSWVSNPSGYKLYGVVPSDLTGADTLIVVQTSTQPSQTYSWHITFIQMEHIDITIGDNATQDVYPNGNVIVLGSGQTYANTLTPYANMITTIDIRGISTITDGTLPALTNEITLILGDSVKTYADSNGNTIAALVLGTGLTQLPTGLTLYNIENVRITNVASALGHIFVKSNTNDSVLYQVDSTTTSNYYNNSTCYAVVGKSLVNDPKDKIQFNYTMTRSVPAQVQSFITLSHQSWSVTTPSGFTNVAIIDGTLTGTATTSKGTYNCSQTHNLINDQYDNSDYLCSLSPVATNFIIFVEKVLVIG